MFFLAPHPTLEKPLRGSPRMFVPDWVERHFSRARPWQIVAVWVPVSLALVWHAVRVSSLLSLAFVPLGVFSWTLLEYILHRFLFHFVPSPDSEFQRDFAWLIHGVHHDYPWDADRLVMPPVATAVVVSMLFPLLWPLHHLFTIGGLFAVYAGLILGYVGYDLVHYDLHHGKAYTSFGRFMRRYHNGHHFATHDLRFGITSPLWDLVFGTILRRDPAVSARRAHLRASLQNAMDPSSNAPDDSLEG